MAEAPAMNAPRRADLAEEVAIARETQRRLLPPSPLRHGALRFERRVLSAGALSGDLVDYMPLADGGIAFVVLDVAGHGIHSALFTALLRSAFRASAGLFGDRPLEDVIAALSAALAHAGTRTHAAACVGLANADGSVVRIAGAMHYPPPLLLGAGHCTPVVVTGKPLGLFEGEHYVEQSVSLPAGSGLVVFSDGVVDGRRGDDDTRLQTLCDRLATAELECDAILAAAGVVPEQLADDVALLLIRREQAAA